MSFLNPGNLWGLLLALPMIAVYLLKVKPRVEQTNTWFLWDQILDQKQANSLFSKLRNFLSLFLMLLVLILVSLGLSNPIFSKRDSRDVIILVDDSASMNGEVDGKPAIEIAKERAHSIISSLSTSQRASIATVNSSVNFLTHLSSNTQELHNAVESIYASKLPDSDEAGRVIERMVLSYLVEKDEVADPQEELARLRTVLITDGCFQYDFKDAVALEKILVSESQRENIGIVAADIQPVIGSSAATVMVQLVNAGEGAQSIELEIFCESTQSIEELIRQKVSPGINKPLFFTVQDAAAGQWKVRIAHEDSMEVDNSAAMILRPLPIVGVSIPQENNYFYQRCVEAFSQTSGSLVIDGRGDDSTSLRIIQGAMPEDLKSDSLVFAPEGDSAYWEVKGGEVDVLSAQVMMSDYPLLKHIDLNSLEFVGAKEIAAPENAKIIVQTETGVPLIYQVSELEKTVLVVNLDPQQNDFFLHTGFIAIIYDAAMYLSGNQERLEAVYSAGSIFSSFFSDKLSLSKPDEESRQNDSVHSYDLNQMGLYALKDGRDDFLTVALLSPAESLLKNNLVNSKLESSSSGYPLSYWLIILAIIILLIESILYHRRKID